MELLFTITHSHTITRVNDPDNRIRLFKVVSPIWSKGALAAHIPCSQLDVPPVSNAQRDEHMFKVYLESCINFVL